MQLEDLARHHRDVFVEERAHGGRPDETATIAGNATLQEDRAAGRDRKKAEMAAMIAAAVPSGPNPQMNENIVKKRKATDSPSSTKKMKPIAEEEDDDDDAPEVPGTTI